MINKITLFIACTLISNLNFCQDFEFTWHVDPSIRSYIVKIIQSDLKREISLKEYSWRHFKTKKIHKSDCDSLFSFMCNYDFPDKGSNIIHGPIFRDYIDTKWLPDSNWVILHNDTLRRELLDKNYIYDKDSNKYYCKAQMMIAYTDGTTYKGEFLTSDEHKVYSVYCERLTDKDYELNRLIYSFVVKYFNKNQYKYLGYEIDRDKPRQENKY